MKISTTKAYKFNVDYIYTVENKYFIKIKDGFEGFVEKSKTNLNFEERTILIQKEYFDEIKGQ